MVSGDLLLDHMIILILIGLLVMRWLLVAASASMIIPLE